MIKSNQKYRSEAQHIVIVICGLGAPLQVLGSGVVALFGSMFWTSSVPHQFSDVV